MKKATYIFLLSIFSFIATKATTVDFQTAQKVAFNFWTQHKLLPNLNSSSNLKLVYQSSRNTQTPLFYVLSTGGSDFIIIAADDNYMPVLGYSAQSKFQAQNIPVEVKYWLSGYESAIAYAIDNPSVNTSYEEQWPSLLVDMAVASKTTQLVSYPVINSLITTTWNQAPFYNIFCPYDSSTHSRAVTGCVATTMAQILRYWSYPTTGIGVHSYTPVNASYGIQKANFANTVYQYNAMPTAVSSTEDDSAAALLSYQAGVSVDMNYSPSGSSASVTGGSGSAQYAFSNYFGYKSSLAGIDRSDFDNDSWLAKLKMELNVSRPFIYVAYDASVGGHAWLCDGYDTNDLLHMNWGWGGDFNGYYLVDNLNPGGDLFSHFQSALIGIDPANPSLALSLNDNVTVPKTVIYNKPFSIATKIINKSPTDFEGDYVARIYNSLGSVVDSVELMPQMILNHNSQTSQLSFASQGSISMVPGNYYVDICYREQGKNWLEAGNVNNFINRVSLTVLKAANQSSPSPYLALNIYPNPAIGTTAIDLGNSTTSTTEVIITIIDMNGREVNKIITAKGQPSATIPVNGLAIGNYMVKAVTADGIKIGKFTVAK